MSKKGNRLTPKQEKFCQAIRNGKNYSDAYREAYDTKNMKMETINRASYTLFQNCKISTRISELRRIVEEKICYTAKNSFDKLNEIQQKALEMKRKLYIKDMAVPLEEETPDLKSAIRAEELKGKLNGLYVEEVKHTGLLPVINIDSKDVKESLKEIKDILDNL